MTTFRVARQREITCKHGIVDEAEFGEPVQDCVRGLIRNTATTQLGREFGPGSSPHIEHSKADGARHSFWGGRRVTVLAAIGVVRLGPVAVARRESTHDQKSTGAGSAVIGASRLAPIPSFSLIFF